MRRPSVCSGHPSLSVNGLRSDLGRRTDAELAILSVLWRQGPCTVREVHEALHPNQGTGYTTVLKLMQLMAQKQRRDDVALGAGVGHVADFGGQCDSRVDSLAMAGVAARTAGAAAPARASAHLAGRTCPCGDGLVATRDIAPRVCAHVVAAPVCGSAAGARARARASPRLSRQPGTVGRGGAALLSSRPALGLALHPRRARALLRRHRHPGHGGTAGLRASPGRNGVLARTAARARDRCQRRNPPAAHRAYPETTRVNPGQAPCLAHRELRVDFGVRFGVGGRMRSHGPLCRMGLQQLDRERAGERSRRNARAETAREKMFSSESRTTRPAMSWTDIRRSIGRHCARRLPAFVCSSIQ
jgi:hypothetical protein